MFEQTPKFYVIVKINMSLYVFVIDIEFDSFQTYGPFVAEPVALLVFHLYQQIVKTATVHFSVGRK